MYAEAEIVGQAVDVEQCVCDDPGDPTRMA